MWSIGAEFFEAIYRFWAMPKGTWCGPKHLTAAKF
jgi:hypothetical protein